MCDPLQAEGLEPSYGLHSGLHKYTCTRARDFARPGKINAKKPAPVKEQAKRPLAAGYHLRDGSAVGLAWTRTTDLPGVTQAL